MDVYTYDNYTSYSDASTPRTPSPRTSVSSDDVQYHSSPAANFKPNLDSIQGPVIFDHTDEAIMNDQHAIKAPHLWTQQHQYAPSAYPPAPSSRGSLLEELYDHDLPDQQLGNDLYHPPEPTYHQPSWNHHIPHHQAHGDHVSHSMRHPHDIAMTRRATFPYVRHDGRGDALQYPPPPFMTNDPAAYGSRPSTVYGEPLHMEGVPYHIEEPHFAHSVPMNNSPHGPMYDHTLDLIKTEDTPVMVPSQNGYCRPPSAGMHGLPCLPPHTGLLVQHTDDAASKETQYLRRRCFNCHTTEPPSWRRSTLNPGKIVCNKCGLYERTHLRPRPLRFDELRAGNKTRKQPKVSGSPKVGKLTPVVKKEQAEGMIQRRASVTSSNGSGGGNSDWDDSVSVGSSSSMPPSSFNSPAVSTFSIPRESGSTSPPRDGGIRLPNAPLSDIASLTASPQQRSSSSPMPRKAATAPSAYFESADMYGRRLNIDSSPIPQASPIPASALPEVTGWQTVPLSDLAPSKAKSRSNSLRKSMVAA